MPKYNDIDLKKWKDYKEVNSDSLWIISRRDKSGAHNNHYHGLFVPQIPRQLLTRYTKKDDWVLDPFMGSGTTLIEAQRMNRNSIGIELLSEVAEESKNRIKTETKEGIIAEVIVGNSKKIDISENLKKYGIDKVQLIIMHPPYWDIIKFSDNKDDLSNCNSLESFLDDFGKIIDNTTRFLENDRYCAVVIGDKYSNSQVIPLGFYCMEKFIEKGFILKGIIVKNIGDTDGKANQQAVWRYRALSADYYIFKHEYIMVFKKHEKRKTK